MFPHIWMCTSRELFLSGAESREITHSWESQEESYPPASELSTTAQKHSISHVKIQSAAPWSHLCIDGAADDSCGRALLDSTTGLPLWHTAQDEVLSLPPKGTLQVFPAQEMSLRHLASGNSAEPYIYFWRAPTGGRGSTGELAGGVMGMAWTDGVVKNHFLPTCTLH